MSPLKKTKAPEGAEGQAFHLRYRGLLLLSPFLIRNSRENSDRRLRREFQAWIEAQGVEIAWPKLTPR
jgi:hypothetical protein